MPSKLNIKPGMRFGFLTVIREVTSRITPGGTVIRQLLCRCSCNGNVKPYNLICLTRSKNPTKSCGCHKLKLFVARNTTHGLSHDPLYNVWRAMIYRCNNPDNKHYGAKGVGYCDEWGDELAGFWAFKQWNDSLPVADQWAPGLEIDRWPNKYGNYEPGNCRWATAEQQIRNRANTIEYHFRGDDTSLATIFDVNVCECRVHPDIDYDRFSARVQHGWCIKDALEQPLRRYAGRR